MLKFPFFFSLNVEKAIIFLRLSCQLLTNFILIDTRKSMIFSSSVNQWIIAVFLEFCQYQFLINRRCIKDIFELISTWNFHAQNKKYILHLRNVFTTTHYNKVNFSHCLLKSFILLFKYVVEIYIYAYEKWGVPYNVIETERLLKKFSECIVEEQMQSPWD